MPPQLRGSGYLASAVAHDQEICRIDIISHAKLTHDFRFGQFWLPGRTAEFFDKFLMTGLVTRRGNFFGHRTGNKRYDRHPVAEQRMSAVNIVKNILDQAFFKSFLPLLQLLMLLTGNLFRAFIIPDPIHLISTKRWRIWLCVCRESSLSRVLPAW